MPRFVTGSGQPDHISLSPILPSFVHDYLASGAGKGARNETLHKVAQQFFAAHLSQSEAETQLLPRAIADGLSQAEARDCIKSAYRSTKVTQPLTPTAAVKGVDRIRKLSAPASVADEADFVRALRAAFEPDEVVAVIDCYQRQEDGAWKPGKAEMKTRKDWERWHAKTGDINKLVGATPGGAYMGINPYLPGSEARSNDNVAAFRHVLVEWDGPEDGSGKPDQRMKIETSGLPVTLLIDSGKKSIHAWVRVDAPTKEEWEKRRDQIFDLLECDRKNKDIARVSRCPGAIRLVHDKPVVQKLLATNIGAKSWAEWTSKTQDLPPLMSMLDLIKESPEPTPEIINGMLNMGCKMLIAGPSKARKSWVLLDLAMSVAFGYPWLGFDVRQGGVLVVNFELQPWMLYQRLEKICNSRSMARMMNYAGNLHFWNLRGKIHDMANLTAPLIAAVKAGGYSLVIIDPVYKGMGDRDENAAGDINRLLNELERVCSETGAALVFAHHFAKGNSSDKSSIDRMSGSGVWARDPDVILTMTPPVPVKGRGRDAKPEPPGYDLDLEITVRAHAPIPACELHWRQAHFERKTRAPAPTYAIKQRVPLNEPDED